MRELNLCYGCMEPLDEEQAACPHCGYERNETCLANYLKPGTILHERYLIGKAQKSNGEGVTYLAYDTSTDCKVLVREYLPEQLCSRVENSTLVNVSYTHLAQYKALMAEYTELNKALARLRNLSHLNPALDLVSENNTTYAVYEYLEGRSLLDYLKENAGELSWNTVRRIFPPLFTSLSLLHNAGVLHRGLSPETIFVTDKGELKLRDFCISAVRTNDTELDAQLFDGYAAPEQYFADRQQGTWTDVYGICAVLYRILTGCRATDAMSRQDYDNLIAPTEVNPHIPEKVSDAIMKGMALDGNDRVRTITDLVTLLFEDNDDAAAAVSAATAGSSQPQEHSKASGATTVFQPAATEFTPQKPATSGHRAKVVQTAEPTVLERVRGPLLIAFLFLAIVAIAVIALTQIFHLGGRGETLSSNTEWSSSVDNVVPALTETTEGVRYNSIMPNLVGMNFQIKRDEMAGWLELEPEYVFSEEDYKDQIIWQELEEGAEFVSGSTIKVKVSRGSSKIELPSFSGHTLEAYLAELEELGFVPGVQGAVTTTTASYSRRNSTTSTTTTATTQASTYTAEGGAKQSVVYKPTTNYKYANGNVCAVEPEPGTVIDVLQGYEITVYYANNPIITTASTTSYTGSWTTSSTLTTTITTAGSTTSAGDATTAATVTTTPPALSTEDNGGDTPDDGGENGDDT